MNVSEAASRMSQPTSEVGSRSPSICASATFSTSRPAMARSQDRSTSPRRSQPPIIATPGCTAPPGSTRLPHAPRTRARPGVRAQYRLPHTHRPATCVIFSDVRPGGRGGGLSEVAGKLASRRQKGVFLLICGPSGPTPERPSVVGTHSQSKRPLLDEVRGRGMWYEAT